jgi:hypothetical protein
LLLHLSSSAAAPTYTSKNNIVCLLHDVTLELSFG